jgi:mutator protein MutT
MGEATIRGDLMDRRTARILALMSQIPVVAAVIQREGRYLVCQRPAHKRHGGLWEFPGGKMHDGESIADAVRRELVEELHVEPSWVGDVRRAIAEPGSPFLIQVVDVAVAGDPRSTEHQAIAWVRPTQVAEYPLAPGDQQFAAWLQDTHAEESSWPT